MDDLIRSLAVQNKVVVGDLVEICGVHWRKLMGFLSRPYMYIYIICVYSLYIYIQVYTHKHSKSVLINHCSDMRQINYMHSCIKETIQIQPCRILIQFYMGCLFNDMNILKDRSCYNRLLGLNARQMDCPCFPHSCW